MSPTLAFAMMRSVPRIKYIARFDPAHDTLTTVRQTFSTINLSVWLAGEVVILITKKEDGRDARLVKRTMPIRRTSS